MSYIGNPPVNGVFRKLDTIAASFNGSTTSFSLTSGGAAVSPGLTTNLIISLGGIIQEPNTAYTVSGSVISFTAAPPAGTSFWGIQLGDVGLASTPNQVAMTTQVFTATAGQTTFTVAGGYTAGQIQVLRNGVQLVVGVDVTATNGTTFVLANAATAGDTLVAVIYTSFIVANAVAKSGDTMSGNLNLPSLIASGTVTDGTGTLRPLVSASAQTASGTSVDFTGIPSWVKRITVMFSLVSTNGTSNLQIQLGDAGGIETSGYGSSMTYIVNATPSTANISTGFLVGTYGTAGASYNGLTIISTLGSNIWASSCNLCDAVSTRTFFGAGAKTLSDTLTQIRITTVNGTDAFDAGTINILYE